MKRLSLLKYEMNSLELGYYENINRLIQKEFDETIKPWLLANNYRLSSAMGVWAVYDKNDKTVYKLPNYIKELMECRIPLYDGNDFGSMIGDFPK